MVKFHFGLQDLPCLGKSTRRQDIDGRVQRHLSYVYYEQFTSSTWYLSRISIYVSLFLSPNNKHSRSPNSNTGTSLSKFFRCSVSTLSKSQCSVCTQNWRGTIYVCTIFRNENIQARKLEAMSRDHSFRCFMS